MEKFMNNIYYCVQWFRAKKRPTESLTESQARKRHARGQLYTALVGDFNRPSCFLEFSAYRSVAVEFLDQALRRCLDYSFQEEAPNQLFLSSVRIPEFPNEVDEPIRATVYYFKTNGHVAIVRYEAHADGVGSRIVGREERQVDVTNNWEPFPEFGQYEGLARMNRDIPVLSRAEQSGSSPI
jgi:hypothetical protein